jgi:hypothetical protein
MTPTTHTSGGGLHYYFKYPGNGHRIKSRSGLSGYPGIDLKADGGYIVAPPSRHINGGQYSWKINLDTRLALIPPWLLEMITQEANNQSNPSVPAAEVIPQGERNETLTSLAGSMQRRGMSREAIEAALLVENQRCDPPLSKKEVANITKSISRYEPAQEIKPLPHKDDWSPPMAEAAYQGLAGEFVRLIEPHTEADPVALLAQFLTAFGNVIGRGAYFQVEADTHYLNLFSVLVGKTSKARKGTAWGHARNIFQATDPTWSERLMAGLSSGEGLIWQVRDAIFKKEVVRDKTTNKQTGNYEEVVMDPGVKDKRLLAIESEFASVLRTMGREGNILSVVIRQAWDAGDLRTLTKNSPAVSTGAHISIIGHITKDELQRYLDRTEAGNGFGNRFIWLFVKRSKCLPEGGKLHRVDFGPTIRALKAVIDFAKSAGEIRRDDEAREIWKEIYPQLSEGKPGLVGALISRAEAQVMRLAATYAVLDQSRLIKPEHLWAALALWDYAEASVHYIFGNATGDPIADQIHAAMKTTLNGLTRTEINNLFGRNIKADRIQKALTTLQVHGLALAETQETGGRTAEVWKVVTK